MPNYRGLNIPHVSFGNVTSDDLFCDKEQELFSFYESAGKANRYRKALDIGANIGVHSILMAKQRWEVWAFEPDPETFKCLRHTAHRNGVSAFESAPHGVLNEVSVVNAAVSDHDGTETFVRVKGNTTGSHLKGDKRPYGELEEFTVPVVDCRPLFDWADFAKIDCEGHEARLLLTLTPEQLQHLEIMVEVGSPTNAVHIYQHLAPMGIGMWTQQRNWQKLRGMADMPVHHMEGALFIGRRAPFE